MIASIPSPRADLIRAMGAAVADEVQPLLVVVFGSHARGTAGPESDVDLLVVERGPFDRGAPRSAELARLWRRLAPFPVAKDVLVFTAAEVERWRSSPNHVVGRALREGIVLHDARP